MRALRGDVRGNTIALVAAALIPLTAMIGSGVDMSRAYMAKQKLQAACDAGALAGRRIMTNDTVNDAVITEARKFFNFNFPQSTYQTASFTPAVTRASQGVVQVSASTTIPMSVMKMFGFETLPLAVTCTASQNFVNTDIMLVLDVTGSMSSAPDGTEVNSGPTSKIVALRAAVLALYDQLAPVQTQLAANGMRLRYGIVPFSSTVNVGTLVRAKDPSYIADSWTYQTRVPVYNTVRTATDQWQQQGMPTSTSSTYTYPQQLAASYCTQSNANGLNSSSEQINGDNKVRTDVTYTNPVYSTKTGYCSATKTTTTTNFIKVYTESQVFDHFNYQQSAWDVRTFVTGAATTTPSETNSSTSTWNGCIEERHTNNGVTTSSGWNIPADANDMSINQIPSSDVNTKWGPQWPEATYYDNSAYLSYYGTTLDFRQVNTLTALSRQPSIFPTACPAQARRLATWTRTALDTYLGTLRAVGTTYLDVGMVWGARFISPDGIFRSANPSNPAADDPNNPNVYNGMEVDRHIIFMTDGQVQPFPFVDSAYGIEFHQHKTGASVSNLVDSGDQTTRHRQRFRMICNAAKGIPHTKIWTIYFGGASVPAADQNALRECASSTDQYSTVANRDALIAKFVQIGQSIGALRLTQ